jgi:RNA polymerase sigma factor (sigma-70 family)
MAYQEMAPGAPRGGEERDDLWRDLVARYGGHVERCVAAAMRGIGWSPQREEVEDVAQDVWLHLFARRPESAGQWRGWSASRWRGYLGAMARNAVVDELRRRCADKRGGSHFVEPCEVELEGEELELWATAEEGPEVRLLEAEREEDLPKRLAALLASTRPDRDASILVLAVVEGHSAHEIAELLGGRLAPGSIHTVVHRARTALAELGLGAVAGALRLGDGGTEGCWCPSLLAS